MTANDRSLKVAVVHSYYSAAAPSGENAAVDAQVSALRRNGFDVRLISCSTDDRSWRLNDKLRTGMRVATGWGNDPSRLIEEYDPDVVHVHNLFPNFGTSWLRATRYPVVATLHNFRSMCANGLLLRDGVPCDDCVRMRSILPAIRHRCYRDSLTATLPLAIGMRGGVSGSVVLKSARRVVVLSERAKEIYAAAAIPRAKLVVLPNVLAPQWVERIEVSAAGHRRGWLFVGRIDHAKGVVQLAERWRGRESLSIVGSGPCEQELLDVVASNSSITYLGQLAPSEVRELMTRSRALIFPSVALENSPMVYAEALATGLPVLAVEGNAVADRVREDRTGMAYPSIQALVEEVSNGVALPESDQIRRAFQERYGEEAFCGAIRAIYTQAINEE